MINDPFHTAFASSGFDFNGIAAANFAAPAAVLEPASLALLARVRQRILARRPEKVDRHRSCLA